MILAEQLVLLALDPVSGKLAPGITPDRLRTGAAGAVLADLVLHKRLTENADGLVLDDALPDFNPVLAETTRALAGHAALEPYDAVRRAVRANGSLVQRLISSLVHRDILHDYREAFFFHRHPVRSMQALREVIKSIHAVMAGEKHPPAAFAIAALADACGVFAARFPAEERMQTRLRIEHEARHAPARGEIGREIAVLSHIAQAVAEAQ